MTENPAMGPDLDLLGDPIQPIRDPRGRPKYAKTKENQRLVITLRGAGWTVSDIATYLGCDEKTLRRYFSRELDHGRVFLEGMALQVLTQKMLEGNVGAAKQVLEHTKGRAPTAAPAKDKTDQEDDAPLGKKELLRKAAGEPPSSWGGLGITDGRKLN